jgi:radical SAM superfamily enzyme
MFWEVIAYFCQHINVRKNLVHVINGFPVITQQVAVKLVKSLFVADVVNGIRLYSLVLS